MSVFVVQLIISCLATFLRIYIVSRMIDLPLRVYFAKVIARVVPVFIISLSVTVGFKFLMHTGLIYSLFIIVLSPIVVILTVIAIGLTKEEKEMGKSILKKFNLRLCKN